MYCGLSGSIDVSVVVRCVAICFQFFNHILMLGVTVTIVGSCFDALYIGASTPLPLTMSMFAWIRLKNCGGSFLIFHLCPSLAFLSWYHIDLLVCLTSFQRLGLLHCVV